MFMKAVTSASVALFGLTAAAHAHEKGDLIVRVGAAMVSPSKEESADIIVTVPPLPNSQVSGLSSDTQLASSVTYMLSDHIGVEGILSLPFEMEADLAGGVPLATGSPAIGSVKYLPEVISLQYYPLDSASAFQPYAGVGINYTLFFDGEASNALNMSAAGPSSVDVDDSIGLALQIGADYQISEKWLINAALWYIDASTDATVSTQNIGDIAINEIEIDPFVFALTVGRKF